MREPEAAHPKRVHAITLLCAESVVSMVEEVSRSLIGLGFSASIITGSDARAALMNRDRTTDVPMIYVVCVQGDLKDTVLGPLRQALATHGGPNEHLFVAVLDLSLPLSMVGQVRRFAEALERAPDSRPDPLDERRQWREHSRSQHFDQDDTRSYRTVRSVDEPSVPRTPTGARPIITAAKPTRIEPTRKYRAITGPRPALPQREAKRSDSAKRRRIKVPGLETRTVEPEAPIQTAPKFGAAIAPESSSSWVGRAALVGVVLLGVAGATYVLGGADRWLPAHLRSTALGDDSVARAGVASKPALRPAADAKDLDVEPADGDASAVPPEPPEPDPAKPALDGKAAGEDAADADNIEATQATPEAVDAADAPDAPDAAEASARPDDADAPSDSSDPEPDAPAEDAEPEPEPEPEPEATPTVDVAAEAPPAEPTPTPAATEAATTELEKSLAAAIERRAVKVSNKYFVAMASRESANWETAKRRCFDLEIDGVGDWRLPFRRELQLLGAIGMLGKGSYWSKTVDTEDSGFAFVYERAGRRLVSWEKSEPAQVACVRRR